MSDWDEDDKNAPLPPPAGLSLGRDGKIDGIHRPQDQRRAPESWRRPAEEPSLELAPRIVEATPIPEPEPVAPRSNRHLFTLISLVVLVSVSGLAIYFHRPILNALDGLRGNLVESGTKLVQGDAPTNARNEPPPLPPPKAVSSAVEANAPSGEFVLTIVSTPPGAEIAIDREALGRTPYIGSHGFTSGERGAVELTLPGYETWTGTIAGGANARLDATLTRSKKKR